MRIKLYKVIVPAKSSRAFDVPAYDIPIIRALWPQTMLIPGQRIEAVGLGITDWRPADSEWTRLTTDYATQVNGEPAWKQVFASKAAFLERYRIEMEEGIRLEAEAEQILAEHATQAAHQTEEPTVAPAAVDELLEDDAAAAPARSSRRRSF